MKKILSWLLALVLTISLIMPTSMVNAASNKIHWADGIITKWMDLGVIHGYGTGGFLPDQTISRAELVQVLNNLLELTYVTNGKTFTDVAKDSWYAQSISKAFAYGFVNGYPDGKFQPNKKVSRQDAVLMIYNALELSKGTNILLDSESAFADADAISQYALNAVTSLGFTGDLTFFGKSFQPKKEITRAEVLKIIDSIVDLYCNKDNTTISQVEARNVIIAANNVTLEGVNIKNNLYITEGVQDGNVTLKNVSVEKAMLVHGGGSHSINILESKIRQIFANKVGGESPRLFVQKGSFIEELFIKAGIILEDVTGGLGLGSIFIDEDTPEGSKIKLMGDFSEVNCGAIGIILDLIGTIDAFHNNGGTISFNGDALLEGLVAYNGTELIILSPSGSGTGSGTGTGTGAGTGTGTGTGSGSGNGGSTPPPLWTMVWNDEFNDTIIDPTKWTYDIGNGEGGWGNNELEYYTSRGDNAKEANGALVITAKKEAYSGFNYTSAKLKTKGLFSKKYGKFEIRAKAPTGKGYWPAIWMLPEDSEYGTWASSGEIDIMEGWGSKPSTVAGTIHYGQNWPNNTYTGKDYDLGTSTIEDYHVYTLEWEPGEMRWYVDGNHFQTQNDWYSKSLYQPTNNSYPAPFDKEFYMIINLAVGGNFDGNPDEDTVFPKTMEIDYVRVYELTGRAYREPVIPVLPKASLPADARMPLEDGNLIYNNNFDQDAADVPNLGDLANSDYWSLFTGDGGVGDVTVENLEGKNYAKLNITAGGWQPYSVQLLNGGSIAKGRYYKLSFDAKSSASRELSFKVGGGAARGYAAYSQSATVALTDQIQHYEIYFQMKQDTDIAARTEFNAGMNTNPVWIGSVRLEEVTSIPFDHDATKSPLNGDGNHVYNGTFDQGDQSRMTYWHFSTATGTAATAAVREAVRALEVNISNSGDGSSSSVRLYQKGIQLMKDQTYQLTLEARASTARDIEVEWLSNDGQVSYGKQTIAIDSSTSIKTATFDMLAATDLDARFQINMGGATGTLQIDNIKMIRTSTFFDPTMVYYPLNNGAFSENLNLWEAVSDSGGLVTSEQVNGEAQLTIGSQGSNPWSAMFIQSGLTVYNGTTYLLKFDARATAPRRLEAVVENGSYTRFIDQTVDLTTTNQTFEFEFTMPKNDTVGLKFLFGLLSGTTAIGASHDVFMDNIVLEVKNAPVIKAPELLADASENKVGTSIELTFTEDADWRSAITAVKLGDTPLANTDYMITEGKITLNSALFSIANNYTVIIEADGYARAIAKQTILANDGNLVINGDMSSGANGWGHWFGEGGVSAFTVENGAAQIAITSIGGASWHTQFFQAGIALLAGKTYELSFKGGSTLARPIFIEFTGTTIPGVAFNLTEDTTKVYKKVFTVDANMTLKLNYLIGNVTNGTDVTPSEAHTISLDDVIIKEVAPVIDLEAPTVPENLSVASKTDTSVSLTWTAATDNMGVTAYEIYESGVLTGTSTTNTFTVSGLTPSTAYSFTIKAKDAAGNVSIESSIFDISTNEPAVAEPQGPVTLYLVGDDSSNSLSLTTGNVVGVAIIPSAAGGDHNINPVNPITYTMTNITAKYNGSGDTAYQFYLDTVGADVGSAVMLRISYDFDGNGTWDRTEQSPTYGLDNVDNAWESFTQTDRGSVTIVGSSYQNFDKGTIKVEFWNQTGTADTKIKVNAPTEFSFINFPYIFGSAPAITLTTFDNSSDLWTGWWGDEWGGYATGTISLESGMMKVGLTTIGAQSYSPQIFKEGIKLVQGKTYHLSFDAYAGVDKKIKVNIGKALTYDPWFTNYATTQIFTLTTAPQTYTFDFTVTLETNENLKMVIELGPVEGNTAATDVYFDNIILE